MKHPVNAVIVASDDLERIIRRETLEILRTGEVADEISVLRENAADGDVDAAYALGCRLLGGDGIRRDDAEARKWLSVAAKAGYASDLSSWGYWWFEEKDDLDHFAHARDCWLLAVKHKESGAMFALSAMYSFGYGVKIDTKEASSWMKRAAKYGNEHAIEWLDDPRNGPCL